MKVKGSPDVQEIYETITASAEMTEAAFSLLQELFMSLFCGLYYNSGLYCAMKAGRSQANAALDWMQENYGRIRNEVNTARLLAKEAQEKLYLLEDKFEIQYGEDKGGDNEGRCEKGAG